MTEHVLSILAYENRQILAEYLLIISISYIAVIIATIYFGQRTRIISPFAKSKITCQQTTGFETVLIKNKTGPDNIKNNILLKRKLL